MNKTSTRKKKNLRTRYYNLYLVSPSSNFKFHSLGYWSLNVRLTVESNYKGNSVKATVYVEFKTGV